MKMFKRLDSRLRGNDKLGNDRLLKVIYIMLIVVCCLNPILCHSDEPVHLALRECVQIALDNNLDIKIAKLDNWIAGTEETYAKSVYDMLLSGKVTYTHDESEKASVISPSKELINEYKVGLEKKLPTGTTLSVDYKNVRDWTDSAYVSLNPYYESEIEFTARQSVLKNLLGIQDRGDVKIARLNTEISDFKTYRKIEKAIADVEKKYWRLVFCKEGLKIKRKILQKAEEMLSINKSHLATGFVEKKGLLASEANVRQRQIDCLMAENDFEDAVNSLKLALNTDFENPILPTDDFETPQREPELIRNIEKALDARRDYLAGKKECEKKKINLVMKKNASLPELDLFATYTANGIDRKFEDSHTLATGKFPKYYIGGELSYPLDNNKAKSEYKKAEFEKVKALNELKRLEKTIIKEIDENVRAVKVNLQKIEKARRVMELHGLKLKEEEMQYRNGRSSSKILIDFQNDYLDARLQVAGAFLDYCCVLIDLKVSKDTLLDDNVTK